MNDLSLLLATDPITYSRQVRSTLEMKAQAEATKVRITVATRAYERRLKQVHREARRRTRTGGRV